MKKTLLAVLFCLCLMILLPMAFAEAETYDLYVGGVQVTSANMGSITGKGIALAEGGYVRYDPTTSTLSLKDVTVTGGVNTVKEGYAYAVYAGSALNIEASGTVTLKGNDVSTGAYGIYAASSLHITNSGDFSALGFDSTHKEVYSYGIRCLSTLRIVNNGTLKADGLKGPQTSFGIRADGDITFDGTGTANVLGRNAVRIVDSDKNITINSGTVIATVTYPKNTWIRLRNIEYGIQCDVLTVAKDASLKVNYSGEDVFYDQKQKSYRIDDGQSYAINCSTMIVEGKVEAENPKLAISGDFVHTPCIAYQIRRGSSAEDAKDATSYGTASYAFIATETGNGVRGSYAVSTADPERFVYTIQPVAGAKYSMDGGAWQESNVFDLIEPQSTHSFLVAAIDDSSFESTGSITFNKLPNDHVPSLRYAVSGSSGDRTLTITPVEGAEYSFNGGATWGTDNTQANIGVETLTIAIRYQETAMQYASASVSAEVDLTGTAPSISFDRGEVDKVYGNSDFVVAATVANIDGALTYTTSDASIAQVDNAGRVHIIGAGTVTVTAAFSDAESGDEVSAQYTLNIAPAALTVKADDKAMIAGAEKPAYTATATGLVNGDTITGITYMDNADTTRNGSYSIMPQGGSISSGNDNYAISYAVGTLTVTVDGSGIDAAVETANAAMEGIAVDDGLPEDVLSGTRFVSTANMTALTDSITDAEKAKDTVSTVDELQAAINALHQAITDFTASIQTGTMIVYTVDAAASPASGGTVSGSGSYRAGETVTVEAIANSGYRFVKWTENGASISTSPSYTIPSISTSRTLVAEFEVDTSASLGYIAFESAKSFTLSVNTKLWNGRLMVSTDGTSWSEWDGSKITAGTIGTDYAIYLRGYGNNNISGLSDIGRFVLTGSGIACRGNIENLLDCEVVAEGNHPVMDSDCFAHLFSGCTALTAAPALPATTLAGSCYAYMFDGCTSLMAAPALPAKALEANCYAYMFRNCSSLTAAPELPATTLANDCYRYMFNSCTALTSASALPATTLTGYCYDSMFKGCTALTTAPTLPATTLATACYRSMFEGCTALTAAPALPATGLANYCYRAMFNGCTGIAISDKQTEEYSTPWRIPTEGTAASATDWNRSMLSNTGGAFKSNPTLGTTYYQKGKAPKTAAPVFAPDGGAFTGSVNVTITCATDGADIYYTTDDTEPTASSSKYENAITLTESATIKAIAVKNGMTGSDIASAIFTKSEPVLGGTAAIKGAAKYGETLSVDTSGITGSVGTLQYQWMSGDSTVGNQAEYTLAASDIGKIISCEVTDTISTGSVTATLTDTVDKADGPAAPTGLRGIAPAAYGRNGTLAGTTVTMEYSTDTAFTVAASCTDDETVVPAGTYYVRYKERVMHKASASTQVVVPSYTPPIVIGIAVNSTAHKTEYFVGDALDVTELTILVTKSDDRTETIPVTAAMVSGFDSSAPAASQTLTITYEGQTATYAVYIKVPAPTIIGVTVSPANANVELGRTQQFMATVSGTGDYDNTVTWSVTGAFSSGTGIDENGLLTVAEDETPGTLTVTATAKGDSTKYGTAEVRVLSVFTVTFKVVNGAWSDGTSGDKTLQVADDATLTAADVPSPGTPNEGYQPASAGAWDTVPNTTTPIGSGMTYTFTFVKKETPNIGTVLADKTTVYQGTALSDIDLSRSNETIPGKLAWQPGQTLDAGENACDWTFTPIDTDQYKVLTGSISITVLTDTPDTLTVKTLPAKAVYVYGEAFDKTGLVLTLTYQSGKTEDIAADAVTVADTTLAVGQTAVNVSYGGLTCDVPVTVNKAEQTITGDGFSMQVDTTVELAGKFTAEGALSYEIAAGDPTGSSVSGSSLTAGSTAGTFTLNILAAETDNYNASQKQVTVTVTPAPVTLYTLTVVNGTGSGEYASGTAVNIAADAPAEGKRFKSWTTTDGGSFGDASSASTTYTMPAGSATITASYEDIPPVTYTVTVTADPTEGGTVTGGGSYSAGTNATVTATANDGYQFISWTRDGNVVGTEASFTFTVSGNISLTAHFDRAPVPPVIIEGENRVVIQGNEALFVSDADFSLFQRVLVDGSELTLNADYAAVSGSTRVTLLGSFTRTLSLSKHSLDIVSSTGTATTEFTIVKATESSLVITRHPEDQFVVEGQKATFSVSVSGGTLPYAYQWYINRGDGAGWKKLGGATDASYTTSVTKLANNSYKYYCTVSDAEGQAEDSNKATLFVSQYVPLPQTGDDSQPLLWLGLMLAGSVGIVLLALRGKKKAV